MEPYGLGCNPGELGGVGEGVRSSDGAIPLTAATSDQRSQVSLPLPMGEGGWRSAPHPASRKQQAAHALQPSPNYC
jgi:hypothetical protein